jgi:hypothetical protein
VPTTSAISEYVASARDGRLALSRATRLWRMVRLARRLRCSVYSPWILVAAANSTAYWRTHSAGECVEAVSFQPGVLPLVQLAAEQTGWTVIHPVHDPYRLRLYPPGC